MFTLVNTWTRYHQGKPRVLREARNRDCSFIFQKEKCNTASPLKWSTPEGIWYSFPLQAAIHRATSHPIQADSTVGNHVPSLQAALQTVSRCSTALHFKLERNITPRQAEARKTMKAFFLPAEYPFLTSEVHRANPLPAYSLTPLAGQDQWPEWQFDLQMLQLH